MCTEAIFKLACFTCLDHGKQGAQGFPRQTYRCYNLGLQVPESKLQRSPIPSPFCFNGQHTHTQQHDKQRPRQQAASKTTRTTTKTTDNNNNPTWARGAQPPAKLRATSAKQHKNKQRPTTTAQNPTTARQYIQLLKKGEKAAGEEPKRTPRVSERKGEAREREREMLNIQ